MVSIKYFACVIFIGYVARVVLCDDQAETDSSSVENASAANDVPQGPGLAKKLFNHSPGPIVFYAPSGNYNPAYGQSGGYGGYGGYTGYVSHDHGSRHPDQHIHHHLYPAAPTARPPAMPNPNPNVPGGIINRNSLNCNGQRNCNGINNGGGNTAVTNGFGLFDVLDAAPTGATALDRPGVANAVNGVLSNSNNLRPIATNSTSIPVNLTVTNTANESAIQSLPTIIDAKSTNSANASPNINVISIPNSGAILITGLTNNAEPSINLQQPNNVEQSNSNIQSSNNFQPPNNAHRPNIFQRPLQQLLNALTNNQNNQNLAGQTNINSFMNSNGVLASNNQNNGNPGGQSNINSGFATPNNAYPQISIVNAPSPQTPQATQVSDELQNSDNYQNVGYDVRPSNGYPSHFIVNPSYDYNYDPYDYYQNAFNALTAISLNGYFTAPSTNAQYPAIQQDPVIQDDQSPSTNGRPVAFITIPGPNGPQQIAIPQNGICNGMNNCNAPSTNTPSQ